MLFFPRESVKKHYLPLCADRGDKGITLLGIERECYSFLEISPLSYSKQAHKKNGFFFLEKIINLIKMRNSETPTNIPT